LLIALSSVVSELSVDTPGQVRSVLNRTAGAQRLRCGIQRTLYPVRADVFSERRNGQLAPEVALDSGIGGSGEELVWLWAESQVTPGVSGNKRRLTPRTPDAEFQPGAH